MYGMHNEMAMRAWMSAMAPALMLGLAPAAAVAFMGADALGNMPPTGDGENDGANGPVVLRRGPLTVSFYSTDRSSTAAEQETNEDDESTIDLETVAVTFVDEDGTVLQSVHVVSGSMPEYTGQEVVKAATEQFTYEFDGWTPEIEVASSDITYTATFIETPVPEPEVEEEAEAEPEVEPEPEQEPETENEPEVEPQVEAEPEPEVEAEDEIEEESEPEPEAEIEPEPEIEEEAEVEPEVEVEEEAAAEPVPEPEAEVEEEPEPEPAPEPEPEPEVAVESESDEEAVAEPEVEAEPEAAAEPESETEEEPEPEPESEPEAEATDESEEEPEPEPVAVEYPNPSISNSRGGAFTARTADIVYTASQEVPEQAESLCVWADLEDVLYFATDEVAITTEDGVAVDPNVASFAIDGQHLTVTVDDASFLRGKTLLVSYTAKLREDADLGPYMRPNANIASVPYQAHSMFDWNEDDVKDSTTENVNFPVRRS